MLRRVEDFAGTERDLRFRHITPAWLTAFQNYLLARGAKWNTVSTYLRMLRAVYLRAVDEGLTLYRPRLFHSVYTGTRATAKRALDEQTLPTCMPQPPCPTASWSRHAACFSCCSCCGAYRLSTLPTSAGATCMATSWLTAAAKRAPDFPCASRKKP